MLIINASQKPELFWHWSHSGGKQQELNVKTKLVSTSSSGTLWNVEGKFTTTHRGQNVTSLSFIYLFRTFKSQNVLLLLFFFHIFWVLVWQNKLQRCTHAENMQQNNCISSLTAIKSEEQLFIFVWLLLLCCRTGHRWHLQSVRQPGSDSETTFSGGPR